MADGIKVTTIKLRGEPLASDLIVDVAYSGDDADADYLSSPAGGQDQWKQPVQAATTANITIATALNNADVLDGVTLATGDRVLVKDQTAPAENGIYVVGTTPARAEDLDEDAEVLGSIVYVIAGTANAGKAYRVTNTAATVVDTDAISWAEFGGGSGSGDSTGHIGATFTAAPSAIAAGAAVEVIAPYSGTITDWVIVGDQTGSITVGVSKSDYTGYDTLSSIVAAAPPAVSGAVKAASAVLTGWTTALVAGDVLRFSVSSSSGFTRATVVLNYSRP